jgi:hypothetical protein
MASHRHEHATETSHGAKSGGGGVHALLRLPEHGERFDEEWTVTRSRIERVTSAPVPRETEPAGAPRLDRGDL